MPSSLIGQDLIVINGHIPDKSILLVCFLLYLGELFFLLDVAEPLLEAFFFSLEFLSEVILKGVFHE